MAEAMTTESKKVFLYGKKQGQKYLTVHPLRLLAAVQNQAELWNQDLPDTRLTVQTAEEFPPPGQRLSDAGELIGLSTLERVMAGEMTLEPGQKIEDGQIVSKTDLELLKAGLLTQADFKQQRIRSFHEQYNAHIQAFVAAYPAQRREGWPTLVMEAQTWQDLLDSTSELDPEDRAAQINEAMSRFPQLTHEGSSSIAEISDLATRVLFKRSVYGAFSGLCNRALDQSVAGLQSVSEAQSIDLFYSACMAIELSLPALPEAQNG
ncbi:MAG: hypothetical protein HS115_11810 [Spirochaetales bacterium]|nr:hypothetical protein [Spirochaetales bacterium]